MLSRVVEMPAEVTASRTQTPRGEFATLVAEPAQAPKGLLLLVHGFAGSKEDFAPLLPLLAAAGWLAVAYDQRGHYETPAGPGADFSLEALAADGSAVATALRAQGPTRLVGHSLGGLVAQAAALRDPSAWETVTLLCSGPGSLGGQPMAGRDLTALRELLAEQPMDVVQDIRVRHAVAHGEAEPPAEVAAFLRRRFVRSSAAAMSAFAGHLLEAPDLVDDVAATGVGVQVARGADDDAWPHAAQDAMASRLGTTVAVIDDAAHSPAIENPAALAAVLIASR